MSPTSALPLIVRFENLLFYRLTMDIADSLDDASLLLERFEVAESARRGQLYSAG